MAKPKFQNVPTFDEFLAPDEGGFDDPLTRRSQSHVIQNMELNMTIQALIYPRLPSTRRLGSSVLLRLDAAYRSYRAFRDLPHERLMDVGLTPQDQAGARFIGFYSRATRAEDEAS